jgi:hypothetical protein
MKQEEDVRPESFDPTCRARRGFPIKPPVRDASGSRESGKA